VRSAKSGRGLYGLLLGARASADASGIASAIRDASRRLVVLGFGRILARLLLVAAIPILARFYDASAFGLFGVFATAGSALTAAVTLCYERGIVPANTDAEALDLTYLAIVVAVMVCLIGEAVLLPVTLLLGHFGLVTELHPLMILLPIGVVFNSIIQTLLQWANRCHLDRVISIMSVLRSAIMIVVQLAASWLAIGGNGLIIGQIVGSVITAAMLWRSLARTRLEPPIGPWRDRLLKRAHDWSDLPFLSFPRILLAAGAEILTIGLMAELFSAADVGLYYMALRVVTIPSQLTEEPITQVFYRAATASLTRGFGVMRPLILTMLCIAMINVPFVLLLVWGADGIFGRLMGAKWLAAADYARIMSIGWLMMQLLLPLQIVPILLDRLKLQLVFEVGSQTARVTAILAAFSIGNFTLCLALLSAQNVLFTVGFAAALLWSNAFSIKTMVRRGTNGISAG
jgi:O-antigen/teichoic acid export membrane protein